MKQALFTLILLLVVASCSTTKKTTEIAHLTTLDSLATSEVQHTIVERWVDTTIHESGKITITELDFYDVRLPDVLPSVSQPDKALPIATLPDIGTFQGVKKMKQTTIEKDKVQKGESKESEKKDKNTSVASSSRTKKDVQIEKKQSTTPPVWRTACYLLAIVLAILLILHRKRFVALFWKMVGHLKCKH